MAASTTCLAQVPHMSAEKPPARDLITLTVVGSSSASPQPVHTRKCRVRKSVRKQARFQSLGQSSPGGCPFSQRASASAKAAMSEDDYPIRKSSARKKASNNPHKSIGLTCRLLDDVQQRWCGRRDPNPQSQGKRIHPWAAFNAGFATSIPIPGQCIPLQPKRHAKRDGA